MFTRSRQYLVEIEEIKALKEISYWTRLADANKLDDAVGKLKLKLKL